MTQRREEVCLYYMGFGLCSKGLEAGDKGCCAACGSYQASGIINAGKAFAKQTEGRRYNENSN